MYVKNFIYLAHSKHSDVSAYNIIIILIGKRQDDAFWNLAQCFVVVEITLIMHPHGFADGYNEKGRETMWAVF